MQFIIIHEKKIIIFWSPKCGCSTLKTILAIYFKVYDDTLPNSNIHKNNEIQKKINKRDKNKIDIYKKYDIVMLVRNPYERLVSGFINKYLHAKFENPPNCNCFYDFCHILLNNPKKIDKHHFEKQLSGIGWIFYNELQTPNIKYILDVSKVNDIGKILDLNIPEVKVNNNKIKNYKDDIKLWSLDYKNLKKLDNMDYSNFYNDDLKNIIYNIYKDDFIFLNYNLNMNYTI